jgi:subtilisin family serine protease
MKFLDGQSPIERRRMIACAVAALLLAAGGWSRAAASVDGSPRASPHSARLLSEHEGGDGGGDHEHGDGGGSGSGHEGGDGGGSEHEGGDGSEHETGDGASEHEAGDGSSHAESTGGGSEATSAADGPAGPSARPMELAADREGREYRVGEVVLVADHFDAKVLAKLGGAVVERRALSSLGGQFIRLRAPDSIDAERFRSLVTQAAPDAAVDLNYVYRESGAGALPARGAPLSRPRSKGVAGIMDTGLDLGWSNLGVAVVKSRSFVQSPAGASHGTVVAWLAAQTGARLMSAAVFTRDSEGGEAASLDAMARAMDWLVGNGATVINLSLEGPPNLALGELIRRAQQRGVVVVAAAGNRGPAAPPVYPAAYPSVVAVTAVDAAGAPYIYANRGAYIMFAARGVDIALPAASRQRASVSGTSYAAPIVTGLLAGRLSRQDPKSAAAAIDSLTHDARHMGPPGRNEIYGYGVLGTTD